MGNRPTNSGIKPYETRSLLSTCQNLIQLNMDEGRPKYLSLQLLDYELTVSNRDDVIEASVTPPTLMLARTGAPNPIEES